MKNKETLDEAFKRIGRELDYTEFDFVSFRLGAQWQAERCYDEEEVKVLIKKLGYDLGEREDSITEWFENNKKYYMKNKETLEELYLNKLIDEANEEFTLDKRLAKQVAVKFAKWQAERVYSEEEVLNLLKKFKKDIINSTELDDDFETLICDIKTNKWFKSYKKK